MEFTGDITDLKHVPICGSKDWSHHVQSLRVSSDYAYDRGREFDKERPSYGVYVPYTGSHAVDEGVCVYEKPNYEGRSHWNAGTHISNLKFPDWNDRISSVRVFGHAQLTGYKDKDFRGERVLIDHDVPDLGELPMQTAENWNHEISSLEVWAEAE